MSSWPNSGASGATVTVTAPEVQAGQTLFSSSRGYTVLEFIGEGCFGKVARCQTLETKETVAVKIIKDTDYAQDTKKEVSMLELISVLNPDHTNMVKFFEQFEYMGQTCLAFEMLDGNLYDLLHKQNWRPLSLHEIRTIAQQLLVALDALKGLRILHSDIKPDNVMFVNKPDQPLSIKLIDFGKALLASEVEAGMELQPTGYRAPEVALGLPFTEAIDVWGVGCVLAFLYLAENIFPVNCDYQMMKSMVEVLGQPEDRLLRAGIYTQLFFSEDKVADGPTWRLMTPEEYTVANNIEALERNSFIDLPSSIDDLVYIYPKREAAEFVDRRAFVDLLKQLLHPDGDLRLSPYQALQHPFITKAHLTEHPDRRALAEFYVRALPSPNAPACRSDKVPTTGSSDGAFVTYSYDENPAAWSSEGQIPTLLYDEDPAFWFSDGDVHEVPILSYDEPFSDGEVPMRSRSDDWFCDRIETTASIAAAPASAGRTDKLLKRIRKLFIRITGFFCCCVHPNVED